MNKRCEAIKRAENEYRNANPARKSGIICGSENVTRKLITAVCSTYGAPLCDEDIGKRERPRE